jgi:Rrf2 family protein
MMFSTKAEYGVRVMVELARRAGKGPVPLAEIAAHDGLPLAYLEHLVARLRKAGLLDSRRGAHGGYLLARPPAEITMAEVVEALEGSIAPIECISEAADGSLVCSRESAGEGEPSQACPTKLLWTRVRFSIVRTLQETTLANLVAGPMIGATDSLGTGAHPLSREAAALATEADSLATGTEGIAPPLAPAEAGLEQRPLTAGA